jgi:hypothetical protein
MLGAEVLLTVMVTVALVAVWADELEATAAREWLPLVSVVVFREKENGAVVTAAPELAPSTLNCTLVVLEETLVETATVPETVAPDAGEVIEIVGGLLVVPPPEPPQGGTVVLFVNGEAITQFFGCGGISGGGIF